MTRLFARPALRRALLPLLAVLVFVLGACGGGQGSAGSGAPAASGSASAAAPAAPAAPAGPPVSVTVATARVRDVPLVLEAPGTVVPVSSVDVRPQVTSVITRVHVREGQFVKAGELLFTLDARADEANVAKLRAQMAKDEAALADAERQLERSRELLAQNFVSQGAVDTNQTLVETARAVLAADRAALDAARLTLGYNRVSAPGGGRVGTINVFAGSSVVANQTTLVTITQLEPIEVAFALPQRHLPQLLAALHAQAPVTVTLPGGAGVVRGRLQFVDNAVDLASGTIKLKARFDNPRHNLWPGAYVATSLVARTLEGAVVIPQASIATTPQGAVAFVVVDGHAVMQPVKVVAALGEEAAVSGVAAGATVVVEGRQNLRPGSAVVVRAPSGAAAASGGGRSGRGAAASAADGAGASR